MKMGKVWLVGAGPGDVELLTVKAKEVLGRADVVIYDALVGQSVIAELSGQTELLYVGKRAGCHLVPQEEINSKLIELAKAGRNVVRLKGGDVFLFGRGGEEVEALTGAGIDFEIIPGISSALAVPAYNGIPVTHRDYCAGVHIITGHRRGGMEVDIDYRALCGLGGTLIFLMSTKSLQEICSGLLEAGMAPDTPAAVLSQGTMANQKRLSGNVSSIAEQMRQNPLPTPTILMVGQVCSLADLFSWYEKLPLFGSKVVLTRPRGRGRELAGRLRQQGAQVIELPTIAIRPIEDNRTLREQLLQLHRFQWLVFTSPSGVECFFQQCLKMSFDIRRLSGIQIAVIGAGTADSLQKKGILPDLMPDTYSAGELGRKLAGVLHPGEHVLIARAREGTPELIQELGGVPGVELVDIPLYDTVSAEITEPVLKEVLAEPDTITVFTSASTVRGYTANAPGVDFSKVCAACIGRQTMQEAMKWHMDAYAAQEATVDALEELVVKLCLWKRSG